MAMSAEQREQSLLLEVATSWMKLAVELENDAELSDAVKDVRTFTRRRQVSPPQLTVSSTAVTAASAAYYAATPPRRDRERRGLPVLAATLQAPHGGQGCGSRFRSFRRGRARIGERPRHDGDVADRQRDHCRDV
jgi:hypothetical protein